MRRHTHFRLVGSAACALVAQACTSYRPALERLAPTDRFRIASDTSFVVTTAGRDRVPTGSCRATMVSGRVLAVQGGTLVVGGSPIIVAAPGTPCDVSPIAIIVSPANVRNVEVRRPDVAKSVWAFGLAAFLIYCTDALLHAAFPES